MQMEDFHYNLNRKMGKVWREIDIFPPIFY